jgi:hypothetical protein
LAYDDATRTTSCPALPRRIIMAKGQVRGNKEAKKPKKDKQVVVPVSTFITTPKATLPHKQK